MVATPAESHVTTPDKSQMNADVLNQRQGGFNENVLK